MNHDLPSISSFPLSCLPSPPPAWHLLSSNTAHDLLSAHVGCDCPFPVYKVDPSGAKEAYVYAEQMNEDPKNWGYLVWGI